MSGSVDAGANPPHDRDMEWIVLALSMLTAPPTQAGPPRLRMSASPVISQASPIGCSTVRISAAIDGLEDERWYCPKVEWTLPDGTHRTEEADCPPFEKRDECIESQEGCGWTGFIMNPDGSYRDIVKECACTIMGYPRRWSIPLCAPAHPNGDKWTVEVRLSKVGKTIAFGAADFYVK